jgi:hypothetical protein
MLLEGRDRYMVHHAIYAGSDGSALGLALGDRAGDGCPGGEAVGVVDGALEL